MTYELLIQHNGVIMLPPVVESVSIEWERQGQPGKLTAEVVKTPGLSFQEGDPCRFSVDGTPLFYGFVFEKSRKGSTDEIIQIIVYDQLYYLKNKDTYVYSGKTATAVLRMIAEDFQLNVGSLVMIPAEVKHWHGAKKDSRFSHIAVEIPGEECRSEWCEPVSDEAYSKL